MRGHQVVIGLRWVAVVIAGLNVAILLLFGIGEMVGGDFSGAGHLIPALFGIGLIILAWKRAWIGGSILVLLGVLNTLRYSRGFNPGWLLSSGVIINGVPLLLAGVIFLVIAWLNQTKDQKQQL